MRGELPVGAILRGKSPVTVTNKQLVCHCGVLSLLSLKWRNTSDSNRSQARTTNRMLQDHPSCQVSKLNAVHFLVSGKFLSDTLKPDSYFDVQHCLAPRIVDVEAHLQAFYQQLNICIYNEQ